MKQILRNNWVPKKLYELGFVGRGKSRHRPRNDLTLYGGPYPFIQTADIMASVLHITKYSQTYSEKGLAQSKLWNENTLCMTIAGENTAETAILSFKACFPDSIVGFIAYPDKANVYFVKYYLDTIKQQLKNVSRGATQDNLSLDKLFSFDILTPSLSAQHKIATILCDYDNLIENNTRRIAILEEMAQALYREWFVYFRYPGHKKKRMVKSALGMIPEGWEVVKFTDIANVLSGGTPKTHISEFWNGLIPFFTPKDAVKSFYVTETEKSITESGLKNCSSRLYPKNTVFITARGTVGKVLLSGVDMAMNQSCYALHGRDYIDQLFIFLTTRNYIDQLKQKSHGAVFDTIIVDTFKLLDIVKPPLDLIRVFCPIVAPIFENVLNLINKNINLRRTRDLLLPKLISGEVDVEGLDIETGEGMTEAAVSIEEDVKKSAEAALAGEQKTLWG